MLPYKPDVIYIGYQRAGSTFLRSYFSHHPDIVWTKTREYFCFDEKFRSAEPYYDANGPKEAQKCYIDMYEGLASGYVWTSGAVPDILKPGLAIDGRDFYADPIEIARRIKEKAPDAKILMVLRNQVDWLRSNYLYHIGPLPKGRKKFVDYLSTLSGKSVLLSGLYHITVGAYYELFGRERVHVMLLEQIAEKRDAALSTLCGFFGIKYVDFPREKEERNESAGNAVGNVIRVSSALNASAGANTKLRPLSALIKNIVRQTPFFNSDVLSKYEKRFIESFYSASNYQTTKLLGSDLRKFGYPM